MPRLSREHYFYRWSRANPPALEISPGEQVTVELWDNVRNSIITEDDYGPEDVKQVNPATGPIAVASAEPGDALAVQILDIQLGPVGHLQLIPGYGLLAGKVHSPVTKLVPVEGDVAIFSDAIRLPIKPMIGLIGCTPAEEGFYTIHCADFGGNMDNQDVGIGSTVYLPVLVPGALLGLGDAHAVMGDGEVSCTGVEVDSEVTLRIDLLKGFTLRRPLIETPDAWVTTGFAQSVEDALEIAGEGMAYWLVDRVGISLGEAVMLLSAIGDFRISQAVPHGAPGLNKSARVWVPKDPIFPPSASPLAKPGVSP
jgi:amidase